MSERAMQPTAMRTGPMSSWEAFARAAGGRWATRPGAHLPTGASIDTRSIGAHEVFFALRGERVDGHDFARAAGGAGASVVVAEREIDGGGVGVLIVEDVRTALWLLAGAHRAALREQRTAVIGVTGSNGKTTTVRLVEAALAAAGPGRRSVKSFNNDLGVPLTILSARGDDAWLCCEIGTSGPGEIARLTELASPEIAVITSVGRAHLEKLGSVAGVANEKSAILTAGEPAALIRIVPSHSAELGPHLEGLDGLVRFGVEEQSKVRVVRTEALNVGQRITLATPIGERSFEVPLAGAHNACNAAAAWAVGLAMALDADRVEAGLARAGHASMRLEVETVRHGGGVVTVINDAYNANPESVLAALELLASKPGRRVAVLGDMLELGDASISAHAEIETRAGACADEVILVGERWGRRSFALSDDPAIVSRVRAGDTVLIKGSRGVRLERVLGRLRGPGGAGDVSAEGVAG
ncbi:MAG: UDP-N-acetylmuramoyl-tripeptide--D-alanyl-D-alanine ligase [Planctomycetota bacterium]